MVELKEGDKAPAFKVPDQDGKITSLSDFKGEWLVLYFYPKDLTPGCTQEACDFTEALSQFKKVKSKILGVSLDSPKRHQKFIETHKINFPLLADEDIKMSKAYGVYKKKSLYGREYMGLERMTFLINPLGKIAKIFPKVKVAGHVDAVLAALKEIK